MFPVRYRPEEILVTYNLEKSLSALIVEGYSDVSLIKWYLNNPNTLEIIPIERIDVPKSFTEAYGQQNNNRGRVIALSKFLEVRRKNSNLFCVADKDFGVLFNNLEHNECIFYTDFTCIEMYYYENEILKKYFQLSCNSSIENIDLLLSSFTIALHELFLIKASNERLNPEKGFSGLDFTRYITIKNMRIVFDKDAYLKAYLNKNNALNKMIEFNQEIECLRMAMVGDSRNFINKYDFLTTLAFFVKHALNERSLFEVICKGRHLVGVVEKKDLDYHPLFKNLKKSICKT